MLRSPHAVGCVQPYVICRGDFVARVANAFGFDADSVWNDPSNDDLRSLRQNPNILLAGDVLYIPDQVDKQPVAHDLASGSTNNFVSPTPPTVTVKHKFVGSDTSTYASRAYTVDELEDLTGLQTDGDGVVTFDVPVTLDTATVVFTDTGESWALSIGGLDPIDTAIGVFQRLQNLGHIDGDVDFNENDLDVIRAGLCSLKGAQATDDDPPPDSSAPDSSPPDDDSPPSSAPESSPDSSSPDSDSSSDSASSASDADNGGDESCDDDAGLADDGTLSADARSMLLSAYGF
jgi:hypothetical protein